MIFDMISISELSDFIQENILMIGIIGASILLLMLGLLFLQWKRVSYRKKHPKIIDWSVDAKREIEYARNLIEVGLLKGLQNEFGELSPAEPSALQRYISSAYGLHAGGLYISVDTLSGFVQHVPHIFLHGSDNVGGEAVLPLKVTESGEHCFYLEELSVCYRRDDYRYVVKFNLYFSLEKTNRPFEEVLRFEVV